MGLVKTEKADDDPYNSLVRMRVAVHDQVRGKLTQLEA
jgi:hypothetical protein